MSDKEKYEDIINLLANMITMGASSDDYLKSYSENGKAFWREHIGIGPGDKVIDFQGRECFVTAIYSTTYGLAIDYAYRLGVIEHGTLYEIWRTVDWNKTTLFDSEGNILKRCKRKNSNYTYKPLTPYGVVLTPKRHKIKHYYILEPGVFNAKPIIYKPQGFFERFEVVD